MENKLLRAKLNKEDGFKIDILNNELNQRHKENRENLTLNNIWQPNIHDLSEIALITGLSVDRARQAFSTLLEESSELRHFTQLQQDSREEMDSDLM